MQDAAGKTFLQVLSELDLPWNGLLRRSMSDQNDARRCRCKSLEGAGKRVQASREQHYLICCKGCPGRVEVKIWLWRRGMKPRGEPKTDAVVR